MESPITIVKSAFNPSKLIGWFVVGLVVFAILDFANLTNFLFYPYTTIKEKYFPGK